MLPPSTSYSFPPFRSNEDPVIFTLYPTTFNDINPEEDFNMDHLYNHQDFKNLSKVGFGGFSSVYAAEWKNTGTKFAIKKFTKGFTDEIINEVCFNFVCLCKPFDITFSIFRLS